MDPRWTLGGPWVDRRWTVGAPNAPSNFSRVIVWTRFRGSWGAILLSKSAKNGTKTRVVKRDRLLEIHQKKKAQIDP